MVSTLKLTKIQIPNSDSDVLSFNSSTGIMTFHKDIKGEGTATTNLQQGLVKAFMRNTSAQDAVVKSFNQSSFTDVGTGQMTLTFTNNMQDAVFLGNATTLTSVDRNSVCRNFATTSMDMHTFSDSLSQANNSTDTIQNCIVNGDLA